jgi:hypothetical protein
MEGWSRGGCIGVEEMIGDKGFEEIILCVSLTYENYEFHSAIRSSIKRSCNISAEIFSMYDHSRWEAFI